MANYFQLNLVASWNDKSGLGAYETGHFLQHQQYLQILAGQNVILPDYNILHLQAIDANEFLTWLNVHENVHELLRAQANVSGFGNLSYMDPESNESFQLWQEAHAQEHRLFDQHFGTT